MKTKSKEIETVTLHQRQEKKSPEACSICKIKRKNMLILPTCARNACNQCIEKYIIESESKNRFYCEVCKRNHIIKDEKIIAKCAADLVKKEANELQQSEQANSKAKSSLSNKKSESFETGNPFSNIEILATVAASSTPKSAVDLRESTRKRKIDNTINDSFKPVVGNDAKKMKVRKPQGQWVFDPEAALAQRQKQSNQAANKPTVAKINASPNLHQTASNSNEAGQVESYTKLKFDYDRCTGKNNKLELNSKFKLEDFKKPGKDDDELINIQPFRADQLLFAYNDKFRVRDQNGNIIESHPINRGTGSTITACCLNDNFIFAVCMNKKTETTHLLKYDHSFKFIGQAMFESVCFSLECTNERVFFTGEYGNEWNPHTIIYVIGCSRLNLINSLTYEVDGNDRIYRTEKLSEPPRSAIYKNRIYFCYQNYNGDKFNRVEYANTNSLYYQGHLDMPAWFMNFRIDSTGNFVYYSHKEKSFVVFDSDGKLLKKLKIDVELNNAGIFCITNNGRLAVVRENYEVEIY